MLKSLWPISLIFFGLGYLVRAALPYPEIPHWITSLLFLAVAIGVAATANTARKKIGNHAKGARGEELAARTLATLPADCHVFHGITIKGGIRDLEGGADIDHVVVTPNAIFAIETKHWHGTITAANNQLLQDDILPDRDPLEQTRTAAKRIDNFLSKAQLQTVPATPVLLFTAGSIPQVPAEMSGVILADLDTLTERLLGHQAPPIPQPRQSAITEALARQVEP